MVMMGRLYTLGFTFNICGLFDIDFVGFMFLGYFHPAIGGAIVRTFLTSLSCAF